MRLTTESRYGTRLILDLAVNAKQKSPAFGTLVFTHVLNPALLKLPGAKGVEGRLLFDHQDAHIQVLSPDAPGGYETVVATTPPAL